MTLTEAWTAGPTAEPSEADRADIRAAVLDYFDGWFEADADRMRRALHPSLAKRSRGQDPNRTPAVASLTAEQMVAWTAAGFGRSRGGPDRHVDVRIDDIAGSIASVAVRSADYIEYVHLVRVEEGWKIVNTLWRYADGHGPST
jgi:hypothetical protein